VVKITIKLSNDDDDESEYEYEDESDDDDDKEMGILRSGIIMECDSTHAFVISDASAFSERIGVNTIMVEFPDGRTLEPKVQNFCTENGITGILCETYTWGYFDTNLVKMIKICDQPLQMSEKVSVYEGFFMRLIPGRVT
jgi:hypothetical protein